MPEHPSNIPNQHITCTFRNVWGLRSEQKAAQVRTEILNDGPTVFALAETRWSGFEARTKVRRWTNGASVAYADRDATDKRPSENHGVLLAIPTLWSHRVRAVRRIKDRAHTVNM